MNEKLTIGVEKGRYLSFVERGVTQIRTTMARDALGTEVELRQRHQLSGRLFTSSDNGSNTKFERVFPKSIDGIVLDLGTVKLDTPRHNGVSSLRSSMTYNADFFSTASIG